MGWPAGEDGIVPPNVRDNSSGLRPIQIAMNQQASFPTSRITMPVNLPASDSAPSALGGPIDSVHRLFSTRLACPERWKRPFSRPERPILGQ